MTITAQTITSSGAEADAGHKCSQCSESLPSAGALADHLRDHARGLVVGGDLGDQIVSLMDQRRADATAERAAPEHFAFTR